jgi:hypothetical protein
VLKLPGYHAYFPQKLLRMLPSLVMLATPYNMVSIKSSVNSRFYIYFGGPPRISKNYCYVY